MNNDDPQEQDDYHSNDDSDEDNSDDEDDLEDFDEDDPEDFEDDEYPVLDDEQFQQLCERVGRNDPQCCRLRLDALPDPRPEALIQALSRNTNVTSMDLGTDSMSIGGARQLAGFLPSAPEKLTNLTIHGTRNNAANVATVAVLLEGASQNYFIRHISLSGVWLLASAFDRLVPPNATNLFIEQCMLAPPLPRDHPGVPELSSGQSLGNHFRKSGSLQELRIHFVFGPLTAALLLLVARDHPHLSHLHLIACINDYEGAQALGTLLARSSSLQELEWVVSAVVEISGIDMLQPILWGLSNHVNLQTISLGGLLGTELPNSLGPGNLGYVGSDSLARLGALLLSLPHLRELQLLLDFRGTSPAACQAFLDSIARSCSLHKVSLTNIYDGRKAAIIDNEKVEFYTWRNEFVEEVWPVSEAPTSIPPSLLSLVPTLLHTAMDSAPSIHVGLSLAFWIVRSNISLFLSYHRHCPEAPAKEERDIL